MAPKVDLPIIKRTIPTTTPTAGVQIDSITPNPVGVGKPATITGSGFGTEQGTVSFSMSGLNGGTSVQAAVISWSEDQIVFQVPAPTSNGEFSATVSVTNSTNQTSQPGHVTVIPAPIITGLSVNSACMGQEVTITGQFFGVNPAGGIPQSAYLSLSQNGTGWGVPGDKAAFTVISWTDGQIVFIVPKPSGPNGIWQGSGNQVPLASDSTATYMLVPGTAAVINVCNSVGLLTQQSQSLMITTWANFPVNYESPSVTIGSTGDGHIQTSVTVDSNGNLTAATAISDSNAAGFLTGFHAAVAIYILDYQNNYIPPVFFDVFGVEGLQSYTGSWNETLSQDQLNRIFSISIVQQYSAESAADEVQQWAQGLANDLNILLPVAKQIASLIEGGGTGGSGSGS